MKLGQHFLTDISVANKIVSELNLSSKDTVLEIGAGKGILSKLIVDKVKKLYLVELDKRLCNLLINKLDKYKNVEIINQDFLQLDLNKFADYNLKIVGNIPYSITSSILNKIFLTANTVWCVCVLMLQKEVAAKLTAKQSSCFFSKLTLITNFYTKVKPLFDVPKECFSPQPKVTSTVVKFLPNTEFTDFKEKDKLLKLIDMMFTHKRKTIVNSMSMQLKIDKNLLQKIVVNSGLNIQARPHQLQLYDYIKLVEKLGDFIK
ncbi:MAG: 16S rRNA (adenine(1518)-N(6)/adenine(1519)-N(6))-dimethyltransferase RsmA [Endomicrobia bacterium]|nr:16S rRNA (adenine(1518)-N(6)/adenine(1519)-N(6))-dimethyltransferase RsmA [Endomicrobiia bacterium]MCX7716674.1 16S rRNA (adenine(1518)-N(6)/adenine(1519)-N(6))-dimethyltransferase RsmA [Endomicrobiia bacterium]